MSPASSSAPGESSTTRPARAARDCDASSTDVGEGHARTVGALRLTRDPFDLDARAELDHPQLAVRVAAVVEPCDRLLSGIAALREGDVRRVEAGFCGEDPLVDLVAPARHACLDPTELELVAVERLRKFRVEHLAGSGPVGREAFGPAEDEHGLVLLRLDL